MKTDDEIAPKHLIAGFNLDFQLKSHPIEEVQRYPVQSGGNKRHVTNHGYRMTVHGYNMTYTGTAASSGSSADHVTSSHGQSGSSWFVAVRNRKTGKIKYKPAAFVTFSPETKIAQTETTTVLDNKDVAREMRDKLTMQFGSMRKKRALEAKMANTVTKDSLSNMINMAVTQIKDDPDRSANDSSLAIKDESFLSAGGTPSGTNKISTVLPPFNPQATTPAEIYDLNDIVSPDEISLMSEAVAQFAESSHSQIKEKGFNDLINELSQTLPGQQQARQTRSAYILYLAYVLALYKVACEEKSFSNSSLEQLIANPELSRLILAKYAESQYFKNKGLRYRLLSAGKDKLMAHVVILLLALNGFTFEMSRLTRRVDVNDQKLTTICHMLGCTSKKLTSTGERVVTLTQPPKEKMTGALSLSAMSGKRKR